MAAVVGKGESYVNVFALGYSGYRQVGLCGSVWLNELPVCHRHYINGSVCGGSPQTGEHVKHTFFYCPPPAATKPPSTPLPNPYITCPVTGTHVYVYSPGL